MWMELERAGFVVKGHSPQLAEPLIPKGDGACTLVTHATHRPGSLEQGALR